MLPHVPLSCTTILIIALPRGGVSAPVAAHYNKPMEKTVLVIAANSLSGESCGHTITFDLSLGKTKGPSPTKVVQAVADHAVEILYSCLHMRLLGG